MIPLVDFKVIYHPMKDSNSLSDVGSAKAMVQSVFRHIDYPGINVMSDEGYRVETNDYFLVCLVWRCVRVIVVTRFVCDLKRCRHWSKNKHDVNVHFTNDIYETVEYVYAHAFWGKIVRVDSHSYSSLFVNTLLVSSLMTGSVLI